MGDLCGLSEFRRVDAQSVTEQGIKRIHIAETLFTQRLNQWGESTEDRNMVLPCYDPLCFIKSVTTYCQNKL